MSTIRYVKGDATRPKGDGCGLSGGRWEEIEPMIEATLISAGLDVTVYDFGD